MQLVEINKARYRKHLNIVIAACVVALAIGSLAIARVFIVAFPDPDGSHFHWNLLGVVTTCLMIGWTLNKYRHHDFMTEVVYVWELKQALNRVTRKMMKIKPAAQAGDIDAMLAMQFSYSGSRQLWQLDDNTITMEELSIWQAELDSWANEHQVELDITKYDESSLAKF